TFVTAAGDVFYGCGIRYRGNTSRNIAPFNYRIELPRGRRLDGMRDLNLNHLNGWQQFFGLEMVRAAGFGVIAPEPRLCRVWLNEAHKSPDSSEGIYVRVEKVSRNFIAKHYPDDSGNIYRGGINPFKNARLDFRPNFADYQDGLSYQIRINNPETAWHSLTNLAWVLDQDVSLYPQVLPQRVNVRQWARFYALHFVIDNQEGSFYSPLLTSADDYFLYADPTDGQFDIIPWDMDNVVVNMNASRPIWESYDTDTGSATVQKFLYNRPIAPIFAADLLDIAENVLSEENLDTILDKLGSVFDPISRDFVQSRIAAKRAFLRGAINTNLTASAEGFSSALNYAVVDTNAVVLTGTAPQAWTDIVRVDGTDTAWFTRSNRWTTLAPVALTPGVNRFHIETFDGATNLLRSMFYEVIYVDAVQAPNTVITANETWNPAGGVVRISNNVRVGSGATLTVAAGTTVMFDPDRSLFVGNGRIDVLGGLLRQK
ncbi:MAG: CotH kinase family protein, partial [Verrucomicrobiota bacterium]